MGSIRRVVSVVGVLVVLLIVGTVVGGVLGSVADMFIPGRIAGTPFGPGHPDTALAWTAVGVLLSGVVGRWRGVMS